MILFLHHNLDYLNSPSQVLCVCEVGQKHLCLLKMIAALYWREQQIVVVAALSATCNGVGGTSSGSWEKKNGMTANLLRCVCMAGRCELPRRMQFTCYPYRTI